MDVETGERGRRRAARACCWCAGRASSAATWTTTADSPFVEFEGSSGIAPATWSAEDEDGVLTFCGRLKRFVKLGGEMISLPAIEAVLERRLAAGPGRGGPSIAVEATPDGGAPGDRALHHAATSTARRPTATSAQAGLSPLHNIRRVVRLDAIPVLGTGKTDYRALRERLQAEWE